MLEALSRRLRDSLQELADHKDPSFLASIERWRSIEREIHGTHRDELEAIVIQGTFTLAVLATHVAFRDNIEAGGCLAAPSFRPLQARLESDDPRFGPYLSLASHGLPVEAEELAGLVMIGPGVDALSPLYQALFSSQEKHASGEHYTPTALCKLMLDRLVISPTTRILDPACGAGAFIVSAIAKMRASRSIVGEATFLTNVHGHDLNPLAVIAARVNAWLQVYDLGVHIETFFDTIRIADALSPSTTKFDVVIGNPPWVTLKDFSSKDRQTLILRHAKEMHVAPDAHGVPQLELATVVFARCTRDVLIPGGSIFFVMTRSFMDGKHCSAFRSLEGMAAAEMWLFDGDDVFPKTFACLLGKRGSSNGSYFASNDSIPVRTWRSTRALSKTLEWSTYSFTHLHDEEYAPVNLVEARSAASKDGGIDGIAGIGRLIPVKDKGNLLPTCRTPHYKEKCFNGATVFPQSLLFINIVENIIKEDPDLVRIAPALGLNAKRPWNASFYDTAVVERRYIFPLVKGSELHPFGFQEPYSVFLPLIRAGASFEFDAAGFSDPPSTRAAAHFRVIDAAYKKTCKNLDRIKDLWARVNFDNELTNEAMAKPFKVIIPDCGSTMAAAIVPGDTIVEHALHYIGLDDEREAWYLVGVLNAPCIDRDVLLRKSERHIGQLALDYPIPPFDPDDPAHAKIQELAREIGGEVRAVVRTMVDETLAKNRDKYQCRACSAFIPAASLDTHRNSCKKLFTSKKVVGNERLFVQNDGATDRVSVRVSRAAIKKVILADSRVSRLMASLDGLVARLLHAGGAEP